LFGRAEPHVAIGLVIINTTCKTFQRQHKQV